MQNAQKRQTWRLAENQDNLPYCYLHQKGWQSQNGQYRSPEDQDGKDNLYIDFYALEDDCDDEVYDADCNTTMHYHTRCSEIREILENEVLLARMSPVTSGRIDA